MTICFGEGVNFVHIASIEGDRYPLSQLVAFAELQRAIAECVVGATVASTASIVGSYRSVD